YRRDRNHPGADRALPVCAAAHYPQHPRRTHAGPRRPGAGGHGARPHPASDPAARGAAARAAHDHGRGQDFRGDQPGHPDHRGFHRRRRLRRAHLPGAGAQRSHGAPRGCAARRGAGARGPRSVRGAGALSVALAKVESAPPFPGAGPSMLIGIPRETAAGEKRVATVPEVVEKLIKLGFRVAVEAGAGDAANFPDETYRAAGAEMVDAARIWANADILFKVRAPSTAELARMREGATLVSFVWPAQNPELLQALAAKKATVLAMDSVPRISRAQKLDALSSMANIAGYRAVIEAAHAFG